MERNDHSTDHQDNVDQTPESPPLAQPEHSADRPERAKDHGQHAAQKIEKRGVWTWLRGWQRWERDDVEVFFSGVVALTAAVGIAGLLVSTYLSREALKETRKSNEAALLSARAAQRQVEVSDRPWLKVDIALTGQTPIHTSNNSMQVSINVLVRNIGRTVASSAFVSVEAYGESHTEPFKEPLTRQKALCDRARAKPHDDTSEVRFMLFPDEGEARHVGAGIDRNETYERARANRERWIRQNPSATAVLPPHPGGIVIVGCVTYRYDTSPSPHQTGFIYTLAQRGEDQLPRILDIDTMGSLAPEALMLQRFFFGGFYAD